MILGSAIYLAFTGGLFGVGVLCFGLTWSLGLIAAVAVHELGHALLARAAYQVWPLVICTPFFGLTVPLMEADGAGSPWTPVGRGLFVLGGVGANVLSACVVQLAGFCWPPLWDIWGDFFFIFWFASLFLCINLLGLSPALDGGQLLLLVTGGRRRMGFWVVGLLGLLEGAVLFYFLSPIFAGIITLVSCCALPHLISEFRSQSWLMGAAERLSLVAVWLFLVVAAVGLLVLKLGIPRGVLS